MRYAEAQQKLFAEVPYDYPLPPQADLYPELRYMGSKNSLLPWIHSVLKSLDFDSAADPFLGSGCVAYLLKSMGKRVIGSDFLNFPTVIAKAASHVPNPGEQMVRYYGWYSNVTRGKRQKRAEEDAIPVFPLVAGNYTIEVKCTNGQNLSRTIPISSVEYLPPAADIAASFDADNRLNVSWSLHDDYTGSSHSNATIEIRVDRYGIDGNKRYYRYNVQNLPAWFNGSKRENYTFFKWQSDQAYTALSPLISKCKFGYGRELIWLFPIGWDL